MSLGLAYWILMLIWALFVGTSLYQQRNFYDAPFLPFVLLLLLGWKVFGAPLNP